MSHFPLSSGVCPFALSQNSESRNEGRAAPDRFSHSPVLEVFLSRVKDGLGNHEEGEERLGQQEDDLPGGEVIYF